MSTSQWSSTSSLTTKTSYMPTNEEAGITASPMQTEAYFGQSTAISGDGTRVAVGASGANNAGVYHGLVYIFRKDSGSWVQETIISPSDGGNSDSFGYSVALDDTGTRIIISSPYNDPTGIANAGAVYIFTRSGTSWAQEAKLLGTMLESNRMLGDSVDIDNTGTRIIAGARYFGRVYIFTRSGTNWTQEVVLTKNGGSFGNSVSIDSTGTRIAIGAPEDTTPSGFLRGRCYIYIRSGTSWTEEYNFYSSLAAYGDNFSYAVDIDGSGSRVLVCHYSGDPSGVNDSGQVFILSRSGTTWSQETVLSASDKAASDSFGNFAKFNNDGSKLIIGCRNSDPGGVTNAGAAYIFTRIGSTWSQQIKLSSSDKVSGDAFSWSVTMSGDGSVAIIGARNKDPSGITNAGKAYIFS